MIHDLQTQLKEAEQLLEMTRTKRDSLIIENGGLIKKNCGLRQRLKATERDTSETKLELEMIEDLVNSINRSDKKLPPGCYIELEL